MIFQIFLCKHHDQLLYTKKHFFKTCSVADYTKYGDFSNKKHTLQD